MDKVKIYLGCDLFVEGQRWQALEIQNAIEGELGDSVEIYNPAKNLDINDKSSFASGLDILKADYERLRDSDYLIALMDTQDVGLAVEMGIAFERGIPIYQLYTDIRLQGNQNKRKLEELSKDIFQNDFMYINKLVTALSYTTKHENEYGYLYFYHEPTIFTNRDELVNKIVDKILKKIKNEKTKNQKMQNNLDFIVR